MFFFYTKMNQASNSYLPSANCLSVWLSVRLPVCLSVPLFASLCGCLSHSLAKETKQWGLSETLWTRWQSAINSLRFLEELDNDVAAVAAVDDDHLLKIFHGVGPRWLTCSLGHPTQTVRLSVCLACFIIWLNKTQPAKMAKAMNSFGFLRYPLPPRLLPLCLAYWVPAKMYLTCLMDFWGPGTQCAETEP